MRRTGLTTLLAMGVMVVMLPTAAYARNNASAITCTGGSCSGTSKADTLSESSGDDQIYGVAGADQIDGSLYSGDTDVLSGGDGSDAVDGGDFDTLDTVAGDGGTNDTCLITENVDTGARDTLGPGCETVQLFPYDPTPDSATSTATSTADTTTNTPDPTTSTSTTSTTDTTTSTATTSAAAPTITYGTSGDDTLNESSGKTDDQIYGVAGNDQINGAIYSGDTDVLSGGDGSDTVDGGDFDTLDTVSGDEGTNDTCVISQDLATGGEDVVGGGCETVKVFSYEFTSGPTVVNPLDYYCNGSLCLEITNCTGGSCYGTSGDDQLTGSDDYDDQIYGMAGNDQISDWVDAGMNPAGDIDVLSGGDGSDAVDGGDFDTLDTVSGDGGTNDTCVITENAGTGASDTLGGGCENVKVYKYLYDPGNVNNRMCWC